MKKFAIFFLLFLFCRVLLSCSKQNEEALMTPVNGIPNCDTVNMKFTANVVPILSTNCYSCHGNGRAFGGVRLDNYANVKIWADGGNLLGSISHASGFSPMPKNAAQLSNCDTNKIRAWISRGTLNN